MWASFGGAISGYGDNVEDTRQYDCDVLVVGSGASGMAAAITAASAGLKVLIIEKEPRFGGSTACRRLALDTRHRAGARAGHP